MIELLALIVLFLYGIAILLITFTLSGVTVSILWGWFVVPLGVPAIGLAQAIGLGMITGLLTRGVGNMDKKPSKEATKKMLYAWARYPIVLFIGWITHLFM